VNFFVQAVYNDVLIRLLEHLFKAYSPEYKPESEKTPSGNKRSKVFRWEKSENKIITIKEAHIESLEIERYRQKYFIIRNLTLKNVRFITRLLPEKEG
jgi:hypothetical protein